VGVLLEGGLFEEFCFAQNLEEDSHE